ncbi:MAG: helix-turn-helix domain-containing protein [SAR324 cluster bacterium]|nr:helix-turn-helix domain-containing protein [SAR324 cluster bacterium]MBF0351796.1 helix-turn-helix domain-containing protein [SAR324 cluster bacterium]
MPEILENAVYTREEAEKLLKISRTTMMRLLKTGVIRAAKVGGQYRIIGAELLRVVLPESGYETARDIYRKSREVIHHLEDSLHEESSK